VQDCFYRIHGAWEKKDVTDASEFMTDWYWQNQQLAVLNRWQRDGLVNHCTVKKIRAIKPILFLHRNEGLAHEDSLLVVSITAYMQDYLAQRNSGKVVEGSKRFKDVQSLWSFTMVNGQWRVSNIEEDGIIYAYVKLAKELPDIESTVMAVKKTI
jgi:hypothetical protein